MQTKYERVVELFRDIEDQKFYGTLTIQFQKGVIQLVRKEETMRGSQLLPTKLKSISGKTAEESL